MPELILGTYFLQVMGLIEQTDIAATCHTTFAMSFLVLPDSIPFLEEDGSNWATFATPRGHAGHAPMGPLRWNPCVSYHKGRSQPHKHGERCTQKVEARKRRQARPPVPEAPGLYPHDQKTAKGRWDRLIEELGQPEPGESNTETGLNGEPPSAAGMGWLRAT